MAGGLKQKQENNMLKEEMFKKYVNLKELESQIKSTIKSQQDDLDLKLTPLKDKLSKILEEKDTLSEIVISKMNEASVKTFDLNGINITKFVRETPKILDHDLVKDFIFKEMWSKVKKLTGISNRGELERELVVITTTLKKDRTLEIIDSLIKVEGVKVPGYEVQKTEYLTVK